MFFEMFDQHLFVTYQWLYQIQGMAHEPREAIYILHIHEKMIKLFSLKYYDFNKK